MSRWPQHAAATARDELRSRTEAESYGCNNERQDAARTCGLPTCRRGGDASATRSTAESRRRLRGRLFTSAPPRSAHWGIGIMSATAVDLFCGCGGLSAGMLDEGIDVQAAYDHWMPALATYRRNIAPHASQMDLSDVDEAAARISDIDPVLLAGAPPCQDFSTAGKRVEAGQANLTIAFGEIVTRCRPRTFLMENVPQVRLSASYDKMRATVTEAGYSLAEVVLDASRFGVPQRRRRFFAFGYLGRDEPAVRFSESLAIDKSEKPLTVKEYMADEIDIDYYYRHPRNYSRRSVFTVYEPSPTIRGVNRPVPPNYQGNRLDSVPPLQVRPLTTRERSRVQTFPYGWRWQGSDRNADAELQIGNAVPVQLAARVAKAVQNAIAA